MVLSPDPWGLMFHGYLGTVFFSNNYLLPYFLFAFIHYSIAWMTKGIGCEDEETQYRYALDQLIYFLAGTFLGVAGMLVTGQRPLIPGDTWRSSGSGTSRVMKYWRSMPQFAPMWNVFAIQFLIRSVIYITGAHQVCYPYYPPPGDDGIMLGWWFSAFLASAMIVASFALTIVSDRLGAFWKAFAFTYEDDYKNAYIAFYIVGLIVLAGLQAVWNFLVLPPTSWPFWAAGTLTAGLVLLAWGLFYIVGAKWLRLDTSHFAALHSRASWGEFCLLIGGIHVLGHIWYIIGGHYGTTRDDFNVAIYSFLITAIVVYIAAFFAIRNNHRVRFRRKRMRARA